MYPTPQMTYMYPPPHMTYMASERQEYIPRGAGSRSNSAYGGRSGGVGDEGEVGGGESWGRGRCGGARVGVVSEGGWEGTGGEMATEVSVARMLRQVEIITHCQLIISTSCSRTNY
jgi:hypothetical protein